MNDLIADQNYFFDSEGNVTTDESKGVRWLAREGANVMEEHREALKAFQADNSKVAPEGEEGEEPKSTKPSANKSEKPTKNKGVKK